MRFSEVQLLEASRYSLERKSDGAGDEGILLYAGSPVGGQLGRNGLILVGKRVTCGSLRARTGRWQDYWVTTPVVEILGVSLVDVEGEESIVSCQFKTKSGSVYTAKTLDWNNGQA
jgi:hypothetical protein